MGNIYMALMGNYRMREIDLIIISISIEIIVYNSKTIVTTKIVNFEVRRLPTKVLIKKDGRVCRTVMTIILNQIIVAED